MMTPQTTVKAETVAMRVVGMTTVVMMTTAETTVIITAITTVAGIIGGATEIAVMAITISTITSEDVICAIASTVIMHPMKAIAVWNMILSTARWV